MTRIAIQGICGSYSEAAAVSFAGDGAAIIECTSFEQTFRTLAKRESEFAVVPVENMIVGRIEEPLRLLEAGRHRVVDEQLMKVEHVLAGTPDAVFDELVAVRSHVEALKQCRNFFATYPHLTRVIGADTASSVRRVVESGDQRTAAICSGRAAEIYGAKIIRQNIADNIENWTKFYLISN
jgi:prephenate dehydratase